MAQDEKQDEIKHAVFKCKIDSNVDELEKLHQSHRWIPGKDNVRPTAEIIASKLKYIENIKNFYGSEIDYICETIFEFDSTFDENGKLIVKKDAIKKRAVFEQNRFPYDVDEGHHYILWYSYFDDSITENKIKDDINANIEKIVDDGTHFDYVWYENPKMTIPDIYHVQVFWINKGKKQAKV